MGALMNHRRRYGEASGIVFWIAEQESCCLDDAVNGVEDERSLGGGVLTGVSGGCLVGLVSGDELHYSWCDAAVAEHGDHGVSECVPG
ncbi:hypothetical protein GCM10022419_014120 [Nonomuraea rosea]|uniref:Uncharacterized protein n=1 Tax=Nonomuraea rosea TaxID=638574 RepID=A0ABP6VIT8_9ACTN